mgnify:FL=1
MANSGVEEMKQKYMNRTILKIALIGYVALLVLLLTVNLMMLHNNYRDNQNAIIRQMQDMADKIEEHLNATNSFLYGIYADNYNFQTLSRSPSAIEEYNNMYDLNNTVELYQVTHDSFDAYFIMSGRDNNVLYRAGDISAEAVHTMKELLSASMNTHISSEQYFFYTNETDCYGLTIYHQGSIAIAGVCDLGKYRTLLQNQLTNSQEIAIWFPGNQEENNARISELAADIRIDPDADSFLESRWNRTLYGAHVGQREVWLLCQDNRSFLNYISLLQIFLLLITILSVVGVIHLYHSLIRRIVRPMYRLMDVMEDIQNNSSSQIPDMNLPFYEMNLMNRTLKNMVEEIRSRKIQYYEEKLSRQEAQLQFMQLQLKPHFFLNCLKSLNTMATDAGMSGMQEIILQISDYLRYFLRIDRKITRLHEEIAFSENYVKLQNLLANRRIDCCFLMEEDLHEWDVPVLCIQTFLENSIKYVRLQQGESLLSIHVQINRLKTEDGRELLNIIIRDFGQGYPDALLPELNRRYHYGINSVGINNIKQRCDILYGEQAEYSFYNMDGAVSELFLPAAPERNREEIVEHETLIGG